MKKLLALALAVVGLNFAAFGLGVKPAAAQQTQPCNNYEWVLGELRYDTGAPGCNRAIVNADGSINVDVSTGTISPGLRTLIPLDVKTVTTGGTAVTAIAAGHRAAGGWLQNPKGATIDLCINEIGTASGTTSSGDTTCIQPGQSYTVAPAAGAVSVITTDSSHPFSGYGMN